MLGFFRKYQRYFFVLITIVIVISFSFFGTYNSLPSEDTRELPAFRAIDGSLISRAELNEMVIFLSTDNEDKLLFGGAWGPNFLNDGAIKNDLFQTGIAEILATQYAAEIGPDLEKRLAFEKRYAGYTHPEAQFISAESAWSYYAPSLLSSYRALKSANSPVDAAALSARVRLYLAEKSFPASALRRALRQQENQYSWLAPDPNLSRLDLSLFGYHTTEDWFGPRFVRIAAEFIINSAKIAEQRGYRVSKAEALADLTQNANLSFKQNINNPQLGVPSNKEYFSEQLRRMGIDQNRAIKIWQRVLLSRRLFQDAGQSLFTSPEMFSEFLQYAKESVQGNLYQLPKELKLADYQALQKFELYLNAVAARTEQEKQELTLPQQFLSPAKIAQKNPELLQKRYLIELAQIDKNDLLTKVGVKETSDWELDEENWNGLKKEFPDLGLKPGNTRSERFTSLEALNEKTRAKIDAFARTRILSTHPEWISEALNKKIPERIAVALPFKGPAAAPFSGVKDAATLITLFDEASTTAGSESQQNAAKELSHYSPDQQHYYAIQLIEKLPDAEVLTFAEANRQGILDTMLNRELQAHYLEIRDSQPEKFQKSDNSWKELADVKDLVADSYFAQTLQAIESKASKGTQLTGNLAAQQRLLPHVNRIKNHLLEDATLGDNEVKTRNSANETPKDLMAAPALAEQWKLEKQSFELDRSTKFEPIDTSEAFNLPLNGWSEVIQSPNGAMAFYQKLQVKSVVPGAIVEEKNQQAQRLLSEEIQRLLASELITEFKAKNAISLDYMNTGTEMTAAD